MSGYQAPGRLGTKSNEPNINRVGMAMDGQEDIFHHVPLVQLSKFIHLTFTWYPLTPVN